MDVFCTCFLYKYYRNLYKYAPLPISYSLTAILCVPSPIYLFGKQYAYMGHLSKENMALVEPVYDVSKINKSVK